MPFFPAYGRLLRSIVTAFGSHRVQALLVACLLIALTQATVFTQLEGWDFLDAFYFSVVSMATVGYGNLVPTTPLGKIATIAFLLVGVGVFVLTVSSIAQAILQDLTLAERREGRSPQTRSPLTGDTDTPVRRGERRKRG